MRIEDSIRVQAVGVARTPTIEESLQRGRKGATEVNYILQSIIDSCEGGSAGDDATCSPACGLNSQARDLADSIEELGRLARRVRNLVADDRTQGQGLG